MGNYLKINPINLPRLNNAEYLSLMNRALNLLPVESDRPSEISLLAEKGAEDIPALGLTGAFIDTFEKDILDLADVVNESRISQETSALDAHDKNRDSLAAYVTTRISRAGSLPMEAERDAGKYLYKVIKPYIGLQSNPNEQETVKIQGLLIDLRKAENAPYAETLGLTAYLAELEKENNAYITLSRQRSTGKAAGRTEFSATLRGRIDGYFDDMAMLAQSHNAVNPTITSTEFVSQLNQLINETQTAYNLRIGMAAASKKKEEAAAKQP